MKLRLNIRKTQATTDHAVKQVMQFLVQKFRSDIAKSVEPTQDSRSCASTTFCKPKPLKLCISSHDGIGSKS